ncbi:hypothetical protein M0805_007648 [Coniferiporia weirii]|nr:hypothetical protein M0805_007648 [Coniferiporia weirii]
MAYSELANWDGSVNNHQKRISPKRDAADNKRGPLDRDNAPNRQIVRYGRSGGSARVRAQPTGGGATIDGAGSPTRGGHGEVPMGGGVGINDQTDQHVASSASADPKETTKGLRTYLSRTKKPVPPPLRDGSLSSALLEFDEETVDDSSDQDSSAKVEDLVTVRDSFSPGALRRHKDGRGMSADSHGERSSAAFEYPEDFTLQYPEPEPDEVVAESKADSSPSPPRKLAFDCVLIPPLAQSRELYKSVDDIYASSHKRGETQRGRRGSELKQPSKKKEARNKGGSGRAARDVIYVSSSSDVPVAKPSVLAATYSSRNARSKDPGRNHSKAQVGGKGTEPRDPDIIHIDSDSDGEPVALTAVTTSNSGRSKASAIKKPGAHVLVHAKRETKVKEGKKAKPVTVLQNPPGFGRDTSATGHARSQSQRLVSLSPVPSLPREPSASEEQEVNRKLPEVESENDVQTVRELIEQSEDALIKVSAGVKTVECFTGEYTAQPYQQRPSEDVIVTQPLSVPAITQTCSPAFDAEDETPVASADRHMSDASRRPSSPPAFTSKESRLSSPGPSRYSLTAPLLHSSRQLAAVKRGRDQDKEKGSSETNRVQSDDDIEEDVFCHSCRNRNVYAKMKCTNVVDGWVCPLSFCHKCIIIKHPEIVFDPYSVMFVCPRCDETCICTICRKKRGVPFKKQNISWKNINVPLLLSEQATLRQKRYGSLSVSAVHRLRDNSISRAASRKAEKVGVEPDKDLDAVNWISAHNRLRAEARKPPGRVFIGEWQGAWGPPPVAVREMDSVELDVHGGVTGKGKGKAIDPYGRLYLGDVRTLRLPFLRAADVYLPATKLRLRKKPVKARKRDDSIEYNESDMPKKKKTRKSKRSSHVPEFTLNHQESEAPSATSSMQLLTPNDFPVPGLVPDSGSQTLQYMLTDPIPDVLGHGHDQDVSNDDPYDAFGFDWERFQGPDIATKPYSYASYDDPSFSYQESYESYASALGSAAALGLRDEPGMVPGYGYGNSAPFLTSEPGRRSEGDRMDLYSATSQDPPLHVPGTVADPVGFSLDVIDPALIGEGGPTIVGHSNDFQPSPFSEPALEDYSRFLKQNANSSRHEAGPFVNGAPGPVVLSKEDLERAVRIALATLALPKEAPSQTVGYST